MKSLNRLLAFALSVIMCFGLFFSGVPFTKVYASNTEWSSYGNWSAWQDAYIGENDYIQVETQTVDDQPIYENRYSYKTVYHYFRYSTKRVADGKGGSDISGTSYGSNYYTYDFDYELTISGSMGNKSRGYKYYYNASTGNTVSGNYITVWKCDPFTTQEIASSWQELTGYTKKTQYRYRTRARIDAYYISYQANGGSGVPATQTKTTVTSAEGTTNNNAVISSVIPTKSFTITYQPNGGSVSPASKSVACTFKGWNTNSGGSGTAYYGGATYTANSDVTLYAQWNNPTAGTLATPTREGHRFDGWYTAATGGTNITSSHTITANTAIYAHWTANTYTVSYNANGGSGVPGNQTKTYGINLTLSTVKPTRKGYIFLGWGESSNDDAKYKAGGTLTKNESLILYAIWQAEKYTVCFDANGGSGAPSAETFEYDKYVTISKLPPEKKYTVTYETNGGELSAKTQSVNCLFLGWNSMSDGSGKSYAPGTPYTSDSNQTVYAQWQNQVIGDLAYPTKTGYAFTGWYSKPVDGELITTNTVISCDMTVYAHWTAEQYEVLFHPTGGQCDISGIHVTYDSPFGALPVPTKTGYRFTGWFSAESGGAQITADTIVNAASQKTLYAHWEAEQYSLFFDAQGGECSVKEKQVTFDAAFGTLPLPKKDGFRFVGWFDGRTDGLLIQEANIVKDNIGTVYAHWSEYKTYVINYDANGGSGAPAAGVKTENENYKVSEVLPKKTITITFDAAGGKCYQSTLVLSCTFTGWNTASNASGTEYKLGAIYSDDSSLLLFAQYSPAFITKLPTATRTGYTLAGWYMDKEKLTTKTALNQDCRFVAKWTPNEYGVYFYDEENKLGFTEYQYDKVGNLSYGIIPEKDGYLFLGWATTENGTVTYQHNQEILNLSSDNQSVVKLYAVWHQLLTINDLSYSFGNQHSAFGYPTDYIIPLSTYRYIFGDNVKAQQLYFNEKSQKNRFWSGNCFGMSATSTLFNAPSSGIAVRDYQKEATFLSELTIGDYTETDSVTLLTFLEGMQISQKCTLIQHDYLANKNKLNELCTTIENARYIDELPIIALFGNEGGHAVVGYAIEKISDTQSRLHIYDCNFPMDDRYITLTTDASTGYTGWYYKINDKYDWGTDFDGAWISYIPYSHINQIWLNRGNISGMEANHTNILSVNTTDFLVKNSKGELIGLCIDGNFTSYCNDVYEMMYTEMETEGFSMLEINLPVEEYTVMNLDESVKSFELSIVDADLGATITSCAQEITLNVADAQDNNSVSVQTTKGDNFSITLQSSADNGYDEVVLTGVSDGATVTLSEKKGKLNCETNNCTQVQLKVDGTVIAKDNNSSQATSENICQYCGKVHPNNVWGKITQFIHRVFFFFQHPFG